MTAHIAKKGLLWAKPQTIGRIIAEVADSGSKSRTTIYAPSFWRWIMYIIRFLPAFVMHRTRL